MGNGASEKKLEKQREIDELRKKNWNELTPEEKKTLRRDEKKKKCAKWLKDNPTLIIMGVLVLILVGLIVGCYFIIYEVVGMAILVTDCGKYRNSTALPKTCPPGREYYESTCVLSCPPGYGHTAACTCSKGDAETECSKYGTSVIPTTCNPIGSQRREFYGSVCYNACPEGATRTAAYTCVSGSTETNCTKYGDGIIPRTCPGSNREFFGTICVDKCPTGFTRSTECTCVKGNTVTDCSTHGNAVVPITCPSGKEYRSGACVNKCPNGFTRTAECTCEGGNSELSCSLYGYRRPLRCPAGKVERGGLCYDPCHNGATRTAVCTCQFPGTLSIATKSGDSCPDGFPYELASLCYAPSGPLTSCYYFSSEISVPDQCNGDEEKYLGACYGKCPAGMPRVDACRCGPLDTRTNCLLYSNATFVGSPGGPSCPSNKDLYAGLCYDKCPVGVPRTAACTCDNFQTVTDCTSTRSVGLDGGPVCGSDRDYHGGLCYLKCPPELPRTAACTCDSFKIVTDFFAYGNPKPVGDIDGPQCPPGTEYYGGLCYSGLCPPERPRIAPCSCSNLDVKTSCEDYGDGRGLLDPEQQGPKCKDDEDYHLGLCYKAKCPSGYARTAICTCQRINVPEFFTSVVTITYNYMMGRPMIL